MSNKKVALEWMSKALENLNSAKYLLNKYPVPIDIIAYHIQQAVELALKAILILENKKVLKTHNLILLYEKIKNPNLLNDYLDTLDDITPFAIEIRYPNSLEISKNEIIYYLEQASQIINVIREKYLK